MRICIVIPILKNKVFEESTYRELNIARRKDVEIGVISLENRPGFNRIHLSGVDSCPLS